MEDLTNHRLLIIDYQMEGSSGAPGPNLKTYFTMKNVIVKRENLSGVNAGPVTDGIYKVLVQSTGQSLDVLSQNTATNSPVGQWPYNAGLNEQWLVTCLGGGQYSIIGRQSGRALSVLNASTANGAITVITDLLLCRSRSPRQATFVNPHVRTGCRKSDGLLFLAD